MTKLKYEDLTNYNSRIDQGLENRSTALQSAISSTNNFISTGTFAGNAAQAAKNYISEVHGGLQSQINDVIENFILQKNKYVSGYPGSVDNNGTVFFLDSNDYSALSTNVRNKRKDFDYIDEINKIVNRVSDICPSSHPSKATKAIDDADTDLYHMNKINNDQSEAWNNYENQHQSDFNQILDTIAGLKKLINAYLNGSYPTMVNYYKGGFGAAIKTELGSLYGVLHEQNIANKDLAKQTAQYLKGVQKSQKTYEKKLKEAKAKAVEKSKEDGWKKFWFDVGLVAAGAAIEFVSGGTATPLLLMIPGYLYTVNDLASDLTQGVTGKETNYLKGMAEHIAGKQTGDFVYNTGSVLSSVVGSSGAYKSLIKDGYAVSKGAVTFSVMDEVKSSKGLVAKVKNAATAVDLNTQTAIQYRGFQNGILPKAVKGQTGIGKEITKVYSKEALKKGSAYVVTDQAAKALNMDGSDINGKVKKKVVGKTVGKIWKYGGKYGGKVVNKLKASTVITGGK